MHELLRAAQSVKDALDAYTAARITTRDFSPEAEAASETLHEAIEAYAGVSVETTGWGSPFARPPAEDPVAPGTEHPDVVHVEASYIVQVNDPDTFREFVTDRILSLGHTPHDD